MTPEAVALAVAGIIWPFLFQALGKFGLQNKGAHWAALAMSFALAFVVTWASGQALTPDAIVTNGAIVATLAQVVYRQLIKEDAPA